MQRGRNHLDYTTDFPKTFQILVAPAVSRFSSQSWQQPLKEWCWSTSTIKALTSLFNAKERQEHRCDSKPWVNASLAFPADSCFTFFPPKLCIAELQPRTDVEKNLQSQPQPSAPQDKIVRQHWIIWWECQLKDSSVISALYWINT